MKSEGKIWILFDAVSNKKSRPLSLVQAQMMLLTLKIKRLHQYFIWTPGWEEWQSVPQFLASGQKYFSATLPPEPLLNKERLKELKAAKAAPPNEHTKTEVIPEAKSDDISGGASRFYTKVVPGEPLSKVDYGYYYNEFTGDDLSLSGLPDKPALEIVLSRAVLGSPMDRRRAARHDFKIEAILLSKNGTSFRTYSKNISVSGTLLEDEIPKDFYYRPFEMILINKFEKDTRKSRVHMQGRIIGDLHDPRRLSFLDTGEEVNFRLAKLIEDYNKEQLRFRKNVI